MANNIVSSFFSSSSLKFTNATTGAVVAKDFKPSSVVIKLSSSPMRHMKEDGTTVVDARIIQPTVVFIEGFCEGLDPLSKINAILEDRASFYTITSKGLVLSNMLCETEQIQQSPDMLSAMPVRLVFKQTISKLVKPLVVSQSADASIISRGMNLLSTASKSVSDLYSSVASKF